MVLHKAFNALSTPSTAKSDGYSFVHHSIRAQILDKFECGGSTSGVVSQRTGLWQNYRESLCYSAPSTAVGNQLKYPADKQTVYMSEKSVR